MQPGIERERTVGERGPARLRTAAAGPRRGGEMLAGRADGERERLPEVVEARVVRVRGQRAVVHPRRARHRRALGDVALGPPGSRRSPWGSSRASRPRSRRPAAWSCRPWRRPTYMPRRAAGRVTRRISATPASASRMNASTSWLSAASKAPSSHGSSSAAPTRTSAPGTRSRHASANCGAGRRGDVARRRARGELARSARRARSRRRGPACRSPPRRRRPARPQAWVRSGP